MPSDILHISSTAPTSRIHDASIEVDGLIRTYRVYVPERYDGRKIVPLMLSFHGRLGTGKAQETMSQFDAVADKGNCIVAYPDGVNRSWNAGHNTGYASLRDIDDVGFVSKLIDKLTQEYRIDRKRIYASGMSNGAIFVQRLACQLPNTIAAIASVAGLIAQEDANDCRNKAAMPILMIHGMNDLFVPWTGEVTREGGKVDSGDATIRFWVEHNRCSPKPKITDVAQGIRKETYRGRNGADVLVYKIEGGGHTWPGGREVLPVALVGETNHTLNASQEIWNFCKSHSIK